MAAREPTVCGQRSASIAAMRHRVGVFSADPVPILRRLGGCSRRAVLLDEGVSERGLARAAAAGHVRRLVAACMPCPAQTPPSWWPSVAAAS